MKAKKIHRESLRNVGHTLCGRGGRRVDAKLLLTKGPGFTCLRCQDTLIWLTEQQIIRPS
jgi:hypothetical protein